MSNSVSIPDAALLEIFKSFASEKRVEMLFTIFVDKQEHTVGDVAARLGIANSTASQHLSVLKRAGVLTSDKRAREVYFRVNKSAVESLVKHIEHWLVCC